MAAGLTLSACAGTPAPSPSSSQNLLGMDADKAVDNSVGKRELTPQEKKIIVNALSSSIRDPSSAKYRWAKIRNSEGAVNYCATVTAKSPYPAYDGLQAYILEANVSGGKVSSAVVGLIAGGKDVEIVRKMCKKYDLDPSDSS